jgi:hypothetical protein
MQDEGLVLLHLDLLGELVHSLFDIDHSIAVVVKGPKESVDVNVHRGGLDIRWVEGIDADAARLDRLANIAVGEDHREVPAAFITMAGSVASSRGTPLEAGIRPFFHN